MQGGGFFCEPQLNGNVSDGGSGCSLSDEIVAKEKEKGCL